MRPHEFRRDSLPRRLDASEPRELLRRLRDEFVELQIIRPVNLVTSRDTTLPRPTGSHQVSSAKIGIVSQRRRFKCNVYQRVYSRPTPRNSCTAMHCPGTIAEEQPAAYDYNVAPLDQLF